MTDTKRPQSVFTPVGSDQRIESLDVLRGFAIFGILMVNAAFFAMPMTEAIMPQRIPGLMEESGATDLFSIWFVKTFFEFKFVSLFSMLFGIGAAIQFDRARAAGRNFDGFFLRRLLILLAFGVTHALVFWYGDILTIYALLGASLLLFCRLKSGVLLGITGALLVMTALTGSGMILLESLAPPLSDPAALPDPAPTGFEALMASNWQPLDPIWINAEITAQQAGPALDLFSIRAITWLMSLVSTGLTYSWHILAMFSLGVVIKRSEFLHDGESGRRLRRWLLLLLPVGLVAEGASAFMLLSSSDSLLTMTLITALREASVPMTMLGYAALIVTLVNAGLASRLFHWLARVGRMALTNYLLETVIMTTIFSFYGLGLFDQVSRPGLIAVTVGIWIFLTLFSVVWLRLFQRGPMEWIWRTLAYLKAPSRRG